MLPGRRTPFVTYVCAFLCGLGLWLTDGGAWACTLFGVSGGDVSGGGTLLVKNRDWKPDHTQEVTVVVPESGWRFVGLFARGGAAPGLRAGVNQAGLTVVSATAGSLPEEERQGEAGSKGILRRLLTECDSVAQALSRTELFAQARPGMYLLADRTEVARLEIGPAGRYAFDRTRQGALFQTNHYLLPALAEANVHIGASSQARAARIQELLGQTQRPATLDALLALSRDAAGGPDLGIWRTGKTLESTRTLATFAVAMPPAGPGRLVVRLANPGQPERTVDLRLDAGAFIYAVRGRPEPSPRLSATSHGQVCAGADT